MQSSTRFHSIVDFVVLTDDVHGTVCRNEDNLQSSALSNAVRWEYELLFGLPLHRNIIAILGQFRARFVLCRSSLSIRVVTVARVYLRLRYCREQTCSRTLVSA